MKSFGEYIKESSELVTVYGVQTYAGRNDMKYTLKEPSDRNDKVMVFVHKNVPKQLFNDLISATNLPDKLKYQARLRTYFSHKK